jgi:hypothetical protein
VASGTRIATSGQVARARDSLAERFGWHQTVDVLPFAGRV